LWWDFKAKDGLVILFKKFDEGKAVYEGDISKDAMLEFIQVRKSNNLVNCLLTHDLNLAQAYNDNNNIYQNLTEWKTRNNFFIKSEYLSFPFILSMIDDDNNQGGSQTLVGGIKVSSDITLPYCDPLSFYF